LEKQLALQFSVLCRFTAFIAVDRSEVVNQGGSLHRIVQPVSYPEGWGLPLAAAAPMMRARRACLSPEQVTAGGRLQPPPLTSQPLRSCAGLPAGKRPAMQPPPLTSQPLRHRQKGKLRRLVDGLLGRADDAAAPAASDLAAYRRRPAQLIERFQQSTGGDTAAKLTALGILAERLAALVEDLQSVAASAAEIGPLRELLQRLRDGLAGSQPSDSEITRLWSDAARMLGAFAAGAGATAMDSGRRDRFWT
jgi:Ca-activated chloride channel family protein